MERVIQVIASEFGSDFQAFMRSAIEENKHVPKNSHQKRGAKSRKRLQKQDESKKTDAIDIVHLLENANDVIGHQIQARQSEIENHLKSDVLSYVGPMYPGIDDATRDSIEARQNKRNKLSVILETRGGLIDVAERLARTFRKHYKIVDFIIPNFSMSAGTILVMSGDSILMNYYSILGPIDPQIQRDDGSSIQALGYLEKFKELTDKSKKGELTTAEIVYLVQHFNPAQMHNFEQTRDLTVALLKDWLVRYKFKNWKTTETRRVKVTKKMKEERAEFIAVELNKTERWHSHSRGISMDVLRKDLKLQVDDFDEDKKLKGQLEVYCRLLKDYMRKRMHRAALIFDGSYEPFAFMA